MLDIALAPADQGRVNGDDERLVSGRLRTVDERRRDVAV